MGNKYSQLHDPLVGSIITAVYHRKPYYDTVDFEGMYEVAGKLILTVEDSSRDGNPNPHHVGGNYYLPHQTPVLTLNNQMVEPNILIGHRIIECDRFLQHKKFLGNQYRYRIKLEDGPEYQLVVGNLVSNPR